MLGAIPFILVLPFLQSIMFQYLDLTTILTILTTKLAILTIILTQMMSVPKICGNTKTVNIR